MKTIKMKGKTLEDAIEGALSVLGAKREDVDINVLSEGKAGVLGVFGGEQAEVEVRIKGSAAEEARSAMQEILDKMGFMTLVSAKEEGDILQLEIKGEDMGRIIGRDGACLEALQLLLGAMLSKRAAKRVRVIVDAEGYRGRKAKKVERVAEDAIKQIKEKGKEATLPPMSSADRRTIHLYMREKEGLGSFSKGSRELRRVVIAPKSKLKKLMEEEGITAAYEDEKQVPGEAPSK